MTGPRQLPPAPPPAGPPAGPGRAVRPAFTGTSATAAFRQRRDQQAVERAPMPSPSSALIPVTPNLPVDDPYNLAGVFDDDRDYSAVLWWTAIWYAVPITLYAIWALGFSPATRERTIHTATVDAVDVAVAAMMSLVAAGLIRRATYSWRAITAGFAGAVIGAGVATLVLSVF